MARHCSDGPRHSVDSASAAFEHAFLRGHQGDAERLKGMALEQAIRHEQLNEEVEACERERWQLLQLLRQKDEQLAWQEESASRQRAVLARSRDTARHFRALCTVRAWRDYVRRLAAERQLSRVKGRSIAATLRHACSTLNFCLKNAVQRQLSQGMRALWFAAALRNLEPRLSCDNMLQQHASKFFGLDRFGGRQCDRSIEQTNGHGGQHSILGSPSPNKMSLSNDLFDDQVLFGTPVRDMHSRNPKLRLSREVSPQPYPLQHRYFSPASDISTCAPSASSQSGVGSSIPSNLFGATRLAFSLEILNQRRLFWAMSQWHNYDMHALAGKRAKVERDALTQIQSSAAMKFREELEQQAVTMRKAVRAEFTEEAELCRLMTSQLEHRLHQAQEVQEEHAAALRRVDAPFPNPSPCCSGLSTPQLRELDAYAELVDRLKIEVSTEREGRQAAMRSLETLKSSYRLLLQRVS